jgi:hypothetical protein
MDARLDSTLERILGSARFKVESMSTNDYSHALKWTIQGRTIRDRSQSKLKMQMLADQDELIESYLAAAST